MNELIAHLFGDYILQSDWMANNKTKQNLACFVHSLTYTLPFLFVTRSPLALFVIFSTHFLIDRFRLARFLVYAKNFLAPLKAIFDCVRDYAGIYYEVKPKYLWENCKATGYPSETPPFMAVWLLIIADNAIHLLINHLSINYL